MYVYYFVKVGSSQYTLFYQYPMVTFVFFKVNVISLILGTLIILTPQSLLAADLNIQAKSCEFSAVQEAVKEGIDSGGNVLVTIPSGTCDWESNELKILGGISIKGSGKKSTIVRGSSESNKTLITVDCLNGKTSKISDLTLLGKGNPAIWDGGIIFFNSCKDFIVSNSAFSNFVNFGINVRGDARGVIFQNYFVNNYREGQTGGTTGYGVVVYGNSTWLPLELGTENAVFVEDNYFIGNRHDIASNDGSRYVFRYNKVVELERTKNFGMVDAHGFNSSPRGSRSWEIYNNTFRTQLTTPDKARTVVAIKGGDGVVFNNILTNPDTVTNMIELFSENKAAYPAKDQMTSGYFWNNKPNTLRNSAPSNYVEGRDYFLYAKPEYKPYIYPHPLRSTQDKPP